MQRIHELSPRAVARMAGVLYLLEGSTSVFGQLIVTSRLVIPGDAAGTAVNVLAHQTLLRIGLAAALLAVSFHIAQTVCFYRLFEPVNRHVALLFVCVSLIAIALQASAALFQLPVLTLLRGGRSVAGLSGEQTQALALLFLRLQAQAFDVFLVLFGFRCATLGVLIARSTFMPRLIGILMVVAGLGYLTLLWPPLASAMSPYNVALAGPGELSLVIWLLLVGVDPQRWNAPGDRGTGERRTSALVTNPE